MLSSNKIYPCTKLKKVPKKPCEAYVLPPEQHSSVVDKDNALEFIKSCEDLNWNHEKSIAHRAGTNSIAAPAGRGVKEWTATLRDGLQMGCNLWSGSGEEEERGWWHHYDFFGAALIRTPDAKRIVRDFESTLHANMALSLGTRRFYEPTNICPLAWYTTWSPQRWGAQWKKVSTCWQKPPRWC